MRAGLVALALSHPTCPSAAPAPAPPLTIVAFGTSLTARAHWQETLRERLASCLGRPVRIVTIARSGATSDWAVAHLDEVVGNRPDIVLIEFAVNDAALTRWISLARSRANIAAVLSGLLAQAPRPRVLSLGMNPVHGPRGWLRPRLATYVGEHARLAAERGAEFVDLRPDWNAMGPRRLDAAIPDGLHPTPEAARAVIAPRLARAIAAGRCAG